MPGLLGVFGRSRLFGTEKIRIHKAVLLHLGQHVILIHQVSYLLVEFHNIHPPEVFLFPDLPTVGGKLFQDRDAIHPKAVVDPQEGCINLRLWNLRIEQLSLFRK